jgi:hypothetical protein
MTLLAPWWLGRNSSRSGVSDCRRVRRLVGAVPSPVPGPAHSTAHSAGDGFPELLTAHRASDGAKVVDGMNELDIRPQSQFGLIGNTGQRGYESSDDVGGPCRLLAARHPRRVRGENHQPRVAHLVEYRTGPCTGSKPVTRSTVVSAVTTMCAGPAGPTGGTPHRLPRKYSDSRDKSLVVAVRQHRANLTVRPGSSQNHRRTPTSNPRR